MRSLLWKMLPGFYAKRKKPIFIKHLLPCCSAAALWQIQTLNCCQRLIATLGCGVLLFTLPWKDWALTNTFLNDNVSRFSDLYSLAFPPCRSRTEFGLPESEACFLQGAGQRRLRGLAVEKEGREGLLFTEMEEVLVCSEGQLPVLVHQWGGEAFFLYLSSL